MRKKWEAKNVLIEAAMDMESYGSPPGTNFVPYVCFSVPRNIKKLIVNRKVTIKVEWESVRRKKSDS